METHFRVRWDCDRGDAHASWGASTWWFEVDRDGTVLRQIEEYDSGPNLRYGPEHPSDEFGMLNDQEIEMPAAAEPVGPAEFETAWGEADYGGRF